MKKLGLLAGILGVLAMVTALFSADIGKLTMIHGTQPYVDLDDDDTLAADSDLSVATQSAVKTYIESGTMTMTNKTLTSPVINTPTIATASVVGDTTVADDSTGGNAGAKSEISGLLKLKVVSLGTMANGTSETTSYTDDSPEGEWAPVDASVTESADTTNYRGGTTSYKATVLSTAAAADGITRTITEDNLEADESIGFWFMTDTALTAGWLTLVLTDSTGAVTYNLPAVAEANINKWIWTEIDISALAGGTGDAVTAVSILLSTAGAAGLGAFNFWIDDMFKWDGAEEESLGYDIPMDGVLSVFGTATATANTGTHTSTVLTEGTDYFVHYQSGSDAVIAITDQSAQSGLALICTR